MSDSPLISILTPVYNGADFLPQLIKSVQEQTYQNIEHIVLDDGSDDGASTVDLLRQHPHLKWWTRDKQGQYATMNELIRACKGEFLLIIGHDDVLADADVIADAVGFLEAHANIDLAHGATLFVNEALEPLPLQQFTRYPYWLLPYHLFFFHCSTFVRRSVLIDNQIFLDESFKYVGDWDWITRLYRAGLKPARMDRLITLYRTHPNQATSIANARIEAHEAREREREEYRRRHMRSPALRFIATFLVSFHRRRLVLRHTLRSAGWRGITKLVRERLS